MKISILLDTFYIIYDNGFSLDMVLMNSIINVQKFHFDSIRSSISRSISVTSSRCLFARPCILHEHILFFIFRSLLLTTFFHCRISPYRALQGFFYQKCGISSRNCLFQSLIFFILGGIEMQSPQSSSFLRRFQERHL